MKTFEIPSLDRIDQVAASFLKECRIDPDREERSPVISFSGEMGAGKTTFIQALCRQLGVTSEVASPTFALVNEYFTAEGSPVFHFDLYRIEEPSELFDMGYEEYFYSPELCLVEWPEKASHLIPEDALRVRIDIRADDTRVMTVDFPD